MNSGPGGRRVVITGLGVVTVVGSELESFWSALLSGQSGIRRITQFDPAGLPCQIAGELPNFKPSDYFSAKEARRMARSSQISLAAAVLASQDAGLEVPVPNPERVGVYIGTAVGGYDKADEGIQKIRNEGLLRASPFALPAALPNMAAFHVSQYAGALGPNNTITTACATGTQTVGEAATAIRHGRADIIFAGGTEALIQQYALAGFASMRALPTSFNDEPERASRPFDLKREGFVFSEGAACLILESFEHAKARDANVYAEVMGHASSSDGFHMAVPDPSASGAVRTMAWALEDAQTSVDEVDYINAHGTSTPVNDAVETLAIKKLFGERAYEIPISSTKSMLGHAMGASGAIEAIVCALSIKRNQIHPTTNYEYPDEDCDLDYVPNEARDAAVSVALSNSFGLGGQNACLVLKGV